MTFKLFNKVSQQQAVQLQHAVYSFPQVTMTKLYDTVNEWAIAW